MFLITVESRTRTTRVDIRLQNKKIHAMMI